MSEQTTDNRSTDQSSQNDLIEAFQEFEALDVFFFSGLVTGHPWMDSVMFMKV